MYKFMVVVLSILIAPVARADELVVNSPIANAVVKDSEIGVDISITRGDMLFIRNISIFLLTKENAVVNSKFIDTTVDNFAKFNMSSGVESGESKEFDLRIIGFGRYLSVVSKDGKIEETIRFINREVSIPIVVDIPKNTNEKTKTKTILPTNLPYDGPVSFANKKLVSGLVTMAFVIVLSLIV